MRPFFAWVFPNCLFVVATLNKKKWAAASCFAVLHMGREAGVQCWE
jgi:hypothetical protein